MKTALSGWETIGAMVKLTYDDGEVVRVSKDDFDRAFGAIITADKADVIRDFAY